MPFEPTTIEHLGLKLYVSLPPVIGELVSNAWDADAERVDVILPEERITSDSEVIVKDIGGGMNADAIQGAYLPIGRKCRDELGRDYSEKYHRPLMGRKGIGKLAAFGVATELEVRTVKDGYAICIRLNYDDMKSWPKGKDYEPKVVAERTGKTKEANGTKIHLRRLLRTRPIAKEWIIRELARRFTVIDDNFKVFVNGEEIGPEHRRLREFCKVSWDVTELPLGSVIDKEAGFEVSGWMGLVEKSSQVDRGVDIFAHGKAVELETMFGLKTTHIQFARAYVVGEVHADFLDGTEDQISTGRNAAHWESIVGQKLQEWGSKSLKWVFNKWLELQRKEKEEKIIRIEDFGKWLNTRTNREQKIAKKLIKTIVEDQNIEPESAGPLLQVIKTNIEFQAFQELVDEMEESGINVQTLLKLFYDWRIIEAREHLKLSDGRLDVMEKLSEYIDKGALEVKQIQPLFEENGWLVNPSWGNVTGQTTYTKLLRKHCKEPQNLGDKNRRIDILGYEVGGAVHVVELKRPEKTLYRSDLEQIERYVDWARSKFIGTGPDAPKYVTGLLIVGNQSSDQTIKDKQIRLAGSDIRVDTFRDLYHRADKIYGEVERRLKGLAPEYSREARRARKEEMIE